jgi:hypothetical protein
MMLLNLRIVLRKLALLCTLAPLTACSLLATKPQPLATSLQELVPHSDRDHRVYVVEHPTEHGFAPAALQVEHVTKLETAGEFEVLLSEDGMATGRVHIRDDGKTLWLLSEDDFSRGLRMAYEPPLPYLSVPLFPGQQTTEASVTMRQLADGQSAGHMQVKQVTEVSAAPAGRWRSGVHPAGVQLRTARTLQSPEGSLDLSTTTLLIPGVGEIRSEGRVSDSPTMRRELACATIGNHSIGDCSALFQRKR